MTPLPSTGDLTKKPIARPRNEPDAESRNVHQNQRSGTFPGSHLVWSSA